MKTAEKKSTPVPLGTNEVVRREGGDDAIYGGAGADWLFGQGGDDVLVGSVVVALFGKESQPPQDGERAIGRAIGNAGNDTDWRIAA